MRRNSYSSNRGSYSLFCDRIKYWFHNNIFFFRPELSNNTCSVWHFYFYINTRRTHTHTSRPRVPEYVEMIQNNNNNESLENENLCQVTCLTCGRCKGCQMQTIINLTYIYPLFSFTSHGGVVLVCETGRRDFFLYYSDFLSLFFSTRLTRKYIVGSIVV